MTHDEIDLAIVYGSADHPGRRVVRLDQSDFPVCSPRIMDRLSTSRDLANTTLLHDHNEETWSRWLLESAFDTTEDRPTVQRDLSEGRLVRLFDHTVPAIHPYYIVTPPLTHMTRVAQALEVWIIEQFKE